MRSLTPLAVALGGVLIAGCGTRFVDLSLPIGSTDGPTAMAPGDASDGAPADAGVPGPVCMVMPVMDTRCLYCPPGADGGSASMICLTCLAPVKTSTAGDYCRTCAWIDIMGQCLQCFAADGTATVDDCDALRASAGAPGAMP